MTIYFPPEWTIRTVVDWIYARGFSKHDLLNGIDWEPHRQRWIFTPSW